MNFDLIIIGNELLNGKIQDKNTFFMAKNLYQQGHHLRKVHLIGDNYQDFSKALIEAQQSVQVVITTGGLGPTKDDLTKEMLASFFNKKITFNEQAYQQTLSHYKRHDRKYNKDKIDYHNLPLEFKALPNSIGYAPGISYTVDAKYIFALPGVPVEFQEMLTQAVLPQLKKYKSEKIKHIIIKTWKTSEANIFHKIAPTLWEQLETFG
ncbi:MAG: competence/damage-inducible protein A, partial [Halobacteriovoraceae bacterium]|nr:competence/damage-inducible protein A [Halobacteriovoraceae bacterium]